MTVTDKAHVFVPSTRPGYEHTCAVAGCGALEHDEEHTGGEGIDPPTDTRVSPLAPGTLCRFGALTVRAYADIRPGEEWEGRYTVYLTGERPSSASRSYATREQLQAIGGGL